MKENPSKIEFGVHRIVKGKSLQKSTGGEKVFDKIPQDLKENALFCLYKMEQRKGKATKVPYQVNGKRADPSNPKCFTDFKTVCEVYNKGGYVGLGMGVFPPYKVFDIDGCVVDGKIAIFAQEIIETLNSYTEYSPSGKGVHIITKVDKFKPDVNKYYINNRKYGLEMYDGRVTHRYITVTGDVIRDIPPMYRDVEVQKIADKYMKRTVKKAKNAVSAPGSFLSDESVIQKMQESKQAEKFKPLWDGEIPEGKSHSEADMSLVQMLAFWCGGDVEQIDRLFRQSGLMRDKWDEMRGSATYGEITIKNALANTTEFYSPMGMESGDMDFNDLHTRLPEFRPESNRRYRGNDLGNGRLFADIFKSIARYVLERKKWYIYDGMRWKPDVGSLKVMELSKDLADALIMHATTIKNEEVRTFFLAICQNGTLDLKTKEFREHSAKDYITKLAPVNYDPMASNSRFETFIDEITSGDKEKAQFLQKALGYGVSGDTRYECMFFLYGETTRNGKGTLMESVLSVMGDFEEWEQDKSLKAEFATEEAQSAILNWLLEVVLCQEKVQVKSGKFNYSSTYFAV